MRLISIIAALLPRAARASQRRGALANIVGLAAWTLTACLTPLPMLTAPLQAQAAACSNASASSNPVIATVAGTSIATGDSGLKATISFTCSGNAPSPRACSTYAALDAVGDAPWTLTREDGAPGGTVDDRIAVFPYIGLSDSAVASSSAELYGNAIGDDGGFEVAFRYQALPGAIVRSGDYAGTIAIQPTIVGLTADVTAPDGQCSDYSSYAMHSALGTVPIRLSITVPESCTVSIPTELDFGDVTDTSIEHDSTATISTTCNSDTLKYNVYIDDGTGAGNGALAMSNHQGGTLDYGLFSDAAHQTPFPREGMGSSAASSGPYLQSTTGSTATIYGRVAEQAPPPAGDYDDRVTVHVEY